MAMQKPLRFFLAAFGIMAVAEAAGAEPKMPADFVRLRDVTSLAREDMRYAGVNNFTGAKVDGYLAPVCWLRKDAAAALSKAAKELDAMGWRLVVYDCYRPTRAVAAFLDWAKLPDDAASKAEYYPRENKKDLFKRGYLAKRSRHSTGTTVDAGAVRKNGGALDFGTPYDFLDERSATESSDVSAAAQANRRKLRSIIENAGFSNYRCEWWHFSFRSSRKAQASNAPVTAAR
jgi:zinc D-Ala-D-Ala dipeptidase